MNFIIKTITNKELKKYLQENNVYTNHQEIPAGNLEILKTEQEIVQAKFIQNQEIKSKTNKDTISNLDIYNKNIIANKLLLSGTDFQIKVWKETLKIPAGKTITYQELAKNISHPKSYRAVANALSQNKIAYFIPCHRVIRKNGELGGYKWGIGIKKSLLEFEKSIK